MYMYMYIYINAFIINEIICHFCRYSIIVKCHHSLPLYIRVNNVFQSEIPSIFILIKVI